MVVAVEVEVEEKEGGDRVGGACPVSLGFPDRAAAAAGVVDAAAAAAWCDDDDDDD